uniref:SGNH hydrolase-type esterase domain-containing protein n=1 Tax=Emiliania huxleyi TaxID=2903 RepID=A0A7S3TN50_EMIHU
MPAYSALVSGGAVRPPRATCLLLASFAAGSGLWLLVGSQKEEQPDVASPRTQRSARSAAQLAKWIRWQAVLASEAAAHTASPGKGSLALWGDSITESWRGTSYGTPAGRANGTPAVLAQTLARRWPSPAVLAISGDQTQHLLWRLGDGGELPPPLASDGALTAVVMIGTNNLGAGHLPGPTAEGVLAVAREYLRRSRGRLLLCALLPRGHTAARDTAARNLDAGAASNLGSTSAGRRRGRAAPAPLPAALRPQRCAVPLLHARGGEGQPAAA